MNYNALGRRLTQVKNGRGYQIRGHCVFVKITITTEYGCEGTIPLH